jgi:hypothetical protein
MPTKVNHAALFIIVARFPFKRNRRVIVVNLCAVYAVNPAVILADLQRLPVTAVNVCYPRRFCLNRQCCALYQLGRVCVTELKMSEKKADYIYHYSGITKTT